MNADTLRRLLANWRDPRVAVVAAVVALSAVALVLTRDTGSGVPAPTEPEGFSVFPSGEAVPRLSPVRVTFESAPSERAGAALLRLDPEVEGEYAWISDRTLLFQPAFPGLLRGKQYTVQVTARPEAGLPNGHTATFVTDGALTVTAVIPSPGDTDVPANAQVLIQFSRSVAPLTLLSEQSTAVPVVFEPPIAGHGEWLNTSLYRFVPETLAPNTAYTARVAAGLTSAADGVLKEDFTWTFTSFGPALDSVTPDDKTRYGAPRQPVTLKFNQPMDRASVESGFRLLDASNGSPVGGSFAWAANSASVVFTPAAPLGAAGSYRVNVPAGLRGAAGGVTATDWSSTFSTVGTPRITETQPRAGATNADRYGIRIRFAYPMNQESVEARVSVSGVARESLFFNWAEEENILFLNAPLKPSAAYTVSVASGATDRYGQALAPSSFSFTTGALPSSVSLAVPNAIGTYSAATEPILYFHATNTTSATFTLYPLTAAEMSTAVNVNHFPPPRPGAVFTPSQPAIRTWSVPVSGPRDEVTIGSTSLTGGGPLAKGDYFVRVSGGGFGSEFGFAVVDTAIVTKVTRKELLAWAVDLQSGAPVADATLQKGTDRATTDANGLASFSIAGVEDPFFKDTFTVTLDGGGRRGLTSTRWNHGSQPFETGLPLEFSPRTYVAHVYTDRPIYRPGEEVHYKGVVRADDDAAYSLPPAGAMFDVVIIDAQGKELVVDRIASNEFGTVAGSLTLPATATIGGYTVAFRTGTTWITSGSFEVAEFRKPEFQVEVTTGKGSYASGDVIDGSAKATFYFGGELAGAATEWAVLATPYFLRVPAFPGFSFWDYEWWRPARIEEVVRARGKAVTGADGIAKFSVPAEIKGNEGAQQYVVAATVTDANAQAVASSTTVTVHPGELYAGIKPSGYLGEAGKEARFDLVTVDTAGQPVAGRPVAVKVYQRKWVTTKEQTPQGARRYKSEAVDTLLATLNTTTDAGGRGSVAYTPSANGGLRVVAEATDSRGRVTKSATDFWVLGGGFASWRITNDDSIRLVADKEKYEVGETAEILVPAPFEGATGLVTVERGKIITRNVQLFPSNAERIRIPITDRSVPNVFVSVVLYRPPTAADPVPRYKVGYVQLPVSTATRELKVTIEPDRAQAKPGDKVRYAIRVTNAAGAGVRAEISVAVVDKAVLALAEERSPSGLKAFWFERGLGVMTASSLAVSVDRSNDAIAEPQRGGKGGGGSDEERLRQDFRNTAYWEAQVVTNADGTATVEVPMPDNLTTWRMQVRAVAGDILVGEGTNELLSTQPLLLRPALPRFLRVGDEATIRLLVRNATAQRTSLKVSLAAEGVTIQGDEAKTAVAEPGQSAILDWPASVATEGTARLTFTASGSGGLSDAVVQELPVYMAVTPEATATGGVVTGSAQAEAIYLPSYAILANGSLSVAVQASLVGSMRDELKEFAREPWETYEGTAKIASRLTATVAVRRADASAGLAPRDADTRQIRTDLASIVSRQRTDGGFAWCDGPYCESDPLITGWALIALGQARSEGLEVDASAIARASAYVTALANRLSDVERPADANQKAFLLYALGEAGAGEANLPAMRSLVDAYRAKLNNWGRASLVLALMAAGQPATAGQVRTLLNDLSGEVIPSANGNHWEAERFPGSPHTATSTTALALDALVHADPAHPLIEETVRWLVNARSAARWQGHVERFHAILALTDFSVATGELAGDFTYNVSLGGSGVLTGRFRPSDGNVTASKAIPLADVGAGKVSILGLVRDFARPGRLYYKLDLRYVTPAREVEALNRGIAITHEYSLLDGPGTRIDRAKLGDVVRVKVTVMAPAQLTRVVADDLLPAGLEPIDPKLKTTDPKLAALLETERRKLNRPAETEYFAPWYRWYYTPWQHVDTRDDRVSLFASTLPKGVHEYVYYARATSIGKFFVAPAHVEESFYPDVFGRSDSGTFTVEP